MDVVELTRALIRFDTVNPPGNEAACARFVGRLLEDGGFKVAYHDIAPGRTSLVAHSPASAIDGAPVVLSGHLDTVPCGSADWQHDPWAAEVVDDRIYGRGASDMKAGVAAMVLAALAEGATCPVILVLSAGEETGCEGARHLARHGMLSGPVRALVVGEPTANHPLIGHKGALWLEVEARGRAAHGSRPDLGDNAILKIVQVINRLATYRFDGLQHPQLGRPSLNIGTIEGGVNINSVPDRARVGIDVRTVPGMRHDELRRDLRALCGDQVRWRVLADMEGFATDPQDPWVQAICRQLRPFLKEAPMLGGAAYFTDAAPLAAAYGRPPTILLGPGNPEQAHQTDEFVRIAQIADALAIYRRILRH